MNTPILLPRHLVLCLLAVCSLGITASQAQATAYPTAASGDAYPVFSAAGFGIEGPDESSTACRSGSTSDPGNHKAFGAHILQQPDAELGRNVFAFISHIDEDSDRCIIFDRVRIEVKGGPRGSSDQELEHYYGDTSYYRWQFRLDENFIGSSSFCHLFQNKAQGGPNSGLPILTLTPRSSELELVYSPLDDSGSTFDLARAPLSAFRGRWVEVYMRQVHTDAGLLEVRINDIATGATILSYLNEDIDLWRETDSPSFINRPKWGIYRKLAAGLRDETVLFAGFCSSEVAANLCPSLLPSATEPPAAVAGALPLDGAQHVPLSMQLAWEASAGAAGYNVYLGTSADPPLVSTTFSTTYTAALDYATTYYYRISATNNLGETAGELQQFTTVDGPDQGGWAVARGHAKPHVEASTHFEFNTSLNDPPGLDTVRLIDANGNAAFGYFSGPKEGTNANYRWRYRQSQDGPSTLVLRASPLEGINNLFYVEFYGLGWRQKVRINRATAKFEKTADVPEFAFPSDFWQLDSFRTLRFTFEQTASGELLTRLYLEGDVQPFGEDVSNERNNNVYLDVGRAGGTEYGAYFDYIAVNESGAFPHNSSTAPPLPSDLIAPEVMVTTQEFSSLATVAIMPNPVAARLRVASDRFRFARYQVTSVTGSVVATGQLDGRGELPVAMLPKGLYLLSLVADNDQRAVARFVKH